ncbi:MAG: hypothetical protein WC319_02195 [Candidatus Paceibacterota bacterium]|jgi:hypothetical protein
MKSLERRFNNIVERNPSFSSYLCFTKAIKGQRFSKQVINRWFQKLVDKDDYIKNEKNVLLRYLYDLSNPSEEGIKRR